MLAFISGNIMTSGCEALVNTVNTVGVMGKGLALQFKKEFPHNFSIYQKACLEKQLRIGALLTVNDVSLHMGRRIIINFPTKTHWRLPAEYGYIQHGLNALKELIIVRDIKSIAIPPLGCGNGGLNWRNVRPLICETLSALDIIIEVYEPHIS